MLIPYLPGAAGPALPTIFGDVVHQGPSGAGSEFDGILVTIQFSREMPGIQNVASGRIVQVTGATVRNNRFSSPFSQSQTTVAQLQVVPTGLADVTITIPANVLGASGTQNVQATKIIAYTPAPATVILSGPVSHQGRGSTIKVLATFDRPITGLTAACLAPVGSRVFVGAPEQEDTEGRDFSFIVTPSTGTGVRLQITAGCVQAVGENGVQNFGSKILTVPFVAPPSEGVPATASIIAPRLHDASEPFKATFQFNRVVSGFTADSVAVTPPGIVSVGGADGSEGKQSYEVQFYFASPQAVASQVTLNVSIPAGAVQGGSTSAWVTIAFDQSGPAPSPLPTPTPACQGVTCSGHGQCRVVTLPGNSKSSPDCQCTPGFSGYSCADVVPVGAANCFDGVKDSGETDVDCGGPCNRKCTTGFACSTTSDCEEGAECFAVAGGPSIDASGAAVRVLRALGLAQDAPGMCQTASIGGGPAAEIVMASWVFEGV